jgi:hypothetical protein
MTKWISTLFYVVPAGVYAAGLIYISAIHVSIVDTFLRDSVIAVLLFKHSMLAYPSAATELQLAMGPGFIAGVLVGIFRIHSARELWKAFIPPGMILTLCVPGMLAPQGIWLTIGVVPIVLVTSIPYSLIGGFVGWQGRKFRTLRGTSLPG